MVDEDESERSARREKARQLYVRRASFLPRDALKRTITTRLPLQTRPEKGAGNDKGTPGLP